MARRSLRLLLALGLAGKATLGTRLQGSLQEPCVAGEGCKGSSASMASTEVSSRAKGFNRTDLTEPDEGEGPLGSILRRRAKRRIAALEAAALLLPSALRFTDAYTARAPRGPQHVNPGADGARSDAAGVPEDTPGWFREAFGDLESHEGSHGGEPHVRIDSIVDLDSVPGMKPLVNDLRNRAAAEGGSMAIDDDFNKRTTAKVILDMAALNAAMAQGINAEKVHSHSGIPFHGPLYDLVKSHGLLDVGNLRDHFLKWDNSLKDMRLAGEGSKAKVWLSHIRGSDIDVAIKEIPITTGGSSYVTTKEVESMEKLSGGDIINFLDHIRVFVEPSSEALSTQEHDATLSPYEIIFMEAADGTLEDLQHKKVAVPEATKYRIMVEMLRGLRKMAKAGFVHRDIKPANIFMFGDCSSESGCHAKIADLGLAYEPLSRDRAEAERLCGTVYYIAPEVWANRGATPKADVFSAGMVLFEMFTDTLPEFFREEHLTGETGARLHDHPLKAYMPVHFNIRKDPAFEKLHARDPKLADFIAALLVREPWRRPNVRDALTAARKLARARGVSEADLQDEPVDDAAVVRSKDSWFARLRQHQLIGPR